MAKTSEDILDQVRDRGLAKPSAGMSVPDGYFEAFSEKMASMLPHRPEIENPQAVAEAHRPRTVWQKVRPYVYMAAMFAGVWCMLQMFASLSGAVGSLTPMSENPVLASALSNDDFVRDYVVDDINSWDVVDEMLEDGSLQSDEQIDAFWADDSTDQNSQDYILPQ